MVELIAAVAFATLVSFFCSVAEAALFSTPVSCIESLRASGKTSGRVLFELRQDIERPITAILTLNTVAHTVGASVAGAAALKVFGQENLLAFSVVFTLIILLFSEIIPKTMGNLYCRTLSPLLALPLKWLTVAFMPAIWMLSLLTKMFKQPAHGGHSTEDDVRSLATLTRRAGHIKTFEESTIQNVLSLDEKTVKDIMTPRTVVFSLPITMTAGETRKDLETMSHSRIPVYEGDDREDVVGLVIRRHLMQELADGREDTPMEALMQPVSFVMGTLSLDKVMTKFLRSRTHLFVVLDEYGGMAGVVTLEDVLEELLGSEIVDETDEHADMRALARAQRKKLATASEE